MNNNLFTGRLTRLVAADPDTVGEMMAKWSRDSEFLQLFDTDVAMPHSVKRFQERIRRFAENERPGNFPLLIQRLEDDRTIGEAALWDAYTPHRNAWLAIGIGEREFWSHGYGTDAMHLILGFAFRELNLHRVTLGTFEYNPRAIRVYEKIGFVHEGRSRGSIRRDGKRWDNISMGILSSEWQAKQNG